MKTLFFTARTSIYGLRAKVRACPGIPPENLKKRADAQSPLADLPASGIG